MFIVVRYFGGIKLGAGGLIRAYTDGCKGVVDKCNIIEIKEKFLYKLVLTYDEHSKLLNKAKKFKLTIKDTSFGDGVVVIIESENNLEELKALIDGEISYVDNN